MSNMKDFVIKFDERSNLWSKVYECNMFVVKSEIATADSAFRAKGYLFVKDVYDLLGLPFTKESITAGWHKPEKLSHFSIIGSEDENFVMIAFSAEEDIRDYF